MRTLCADLYNSFAEAKNNNSFVNGKYFPLNIFLNDILLRVHVHPLMCIFHYLTNIKKVCDFSRKLKAYLNL